MSADLREAFHVAAVSYLGWRKTNLEQAQWGWIDAATRQRAYRPEPEVQFFGRSYTLSQIAALACVLSGPLPASLKATFVLIDDGVGEPIPESYPEAVTALTDGIACELDLQASTPLTEPPLVDRIREKSFREGVAAAADAIRQEARL